MYRIILFPFIALCLAFPVSAQEKPTPEESEKLVIELFEIMYSDTTVAYMQSALVKFINPVELISYKNKYPEYTINMLGGAYYQIDKNDGERVEVNTKTLRAKDWESKCVLKVIKSSGKLYFSANMRPDWIDLWVSFEDYQ